MKKYLKLVISNPVFSGSAVMIVGSNATSFINLLYHFIVGRLLGPIFYGELAALISLVGLLSVIPFSLGLVIVKFVSSAKNEKEIEKLIGFLSGKVFIFGLIMFLVISLFSFQLAGFLNIKNPLLLILVAATFMFTLPALLYRSVLQGLVRFNQLVISTLGENLTKLILTILVILVGLSLSGVVFVYVLSAICGFLLVRFFTRDLKAKSGSNKFKVSPVIYYSVAVLVQSISITSLYSTDLIMVKHFFSSFDSGLYSALSTLGRIIFFGTGPISAVMFPMVAKKHTAGEDYFKVFLTSLGLTLLLSFAILFIYWLFPNFAVSLLYGSAYLQISSLLLWFGLAMTAFATASLFLSFYLSLGETKIVILPLIAAISQSFAIWLFHQNLNSIVLINLLVNSLLVICLVLYSLPFRFIRKKLLYNLLK